MKARKRNVSEMRKRTSGKKMTSHHSLAGALVFFAAIIVCSAAWPQQHNNVRAKVPPASTFKEKPVPFAVGETLSYRASWSAFSTAASLKLTTVERRDLFGSATWHFRGEAHTLSPVRNLFPVDDEFDSYTDVASLDSLQFETHQNELGKSSNQVSHLAVSGKPSHLPPPIVLVPPGTRDALGVLYALRAVDWVHTPEVRAPVYDGHDIFNVVANREAMGESVKVAAGEYPTTRISVHIFQHDKELTNVQYTLWVASDAARLPVQMEAVLPFGTIHVELLSVTR